MARKSEGGAGIKESRSCERYLSGDPGYQGMLQRDP